MTRAADAARFLPAVGVVHELFDNRGVTVQSIDMSAPAGDAPAGAEGFRPEDMAPTVARGRNIIAVTPPAPWALAETLEGLLRRDLPDQLAVIILAGEGMLAEIVADTVAVVGDRARVVAGGVPERAARLLAEPGRAILVTTPAVAVALRARSSLPIEAVTAIILAWPETWPDEVEVAAAMADAPKDNQRILHTYDRAATAALAERYLRKPVVFGEDPVGEAGEGFPVVLVATTPWVGRAGAIARALAHLNPTDPQVWTATPERAAELSDALARLGERVAVVSGDAGVGTVLAADLPSGPLLRRLAASSRALVLFPTPDALPYLTRITSEQRPVLLSTAVERTRAAAARRRAAIGTILEGKDGAGAVTGELHVLAPLFERHDPAAVAAALYRLWTEAGTRALPEASAPREAPASAKVFVNVGRRDGATPADFVAVLTKELGVDGRRIGRVEIRDGHSLIDVPALEAPGIAQRLTGRTIRRRKVAARLDRGPQR